MEVLVQGNLLREENVHHVAFLVEAHALDGQEARVVQVTERGRLSEDVVDDLMLHLLEVDDSGDQGKRGLVLLIKGLDFEERAQRILLLTFVELLVETELFLSGEDTIREVERLGAVVGFSQGIQIVAEPVLFL